LAGACRRRAGGRDAYACRDGSGLVCCPERGDRSPLCGFPARGRRDFLPCPAVTRAAADRSQTATAQRRSPAGAAYPEEPVPIPLPIGHSAAAPLLLPPPRKERIPPSGDRTESEGTG